MDDFDGKAFTDQIDHIMALEDGSLEYIFKDGRQSMSGLPIKAAENAVRTSISAMI